MLVFGLLVSLNQLRYFRSSSHRLDQDDVTLVQEHAVRTMPLVATAYKDTGNGFGFLIYLVLNVVNVGQFRKRGTGIDELSIVKLTVIKQYRGIRSGNFWALVTIPVFTSC